MRVSDGELTLREAIVADAVTLGGWWRDGSVMAHAGFPLGLDITDERIAEDLATQSDGTRRTLIVEVGGRPVGEMNFRHRDDGAVDIGIKICPADWQEKGYGSRALRLLIETLFESGCDKIVLDTNLDNARAQHVYEKLGFQKVGIRPDSWTDQLGRLQSAVDYRLARSGWTSVRRCLSVDVNAFKQMLGSCFRDDYHMPLTDRQVDGLCSKITEQAAADTVLVDLAWCGEAPVGFITYQVDGPSSDWNEFPGWGLIRECYTTPERRREGVGRALATQAEAVLKGRNVPGVYLTTDDAQEFWTAMGYRDTGQICARNQGEIFEKRWRN